VTRQGNEQPPATSREARKDRGGLIAPAVIVLGISFSLSSVFDLVVAIAMACGFIASIGRIRSYVERRDLVLVITSTSLRRFVYDKEVEISWRDVAMKTSRGKAAGSELPWKLVEKAIESA
jgi:hypothetical protein